MCGGFEFGKFELDILNEGRSILFSDGWGQCHVDGRVLLPFNIFGTEGSFGTFGMDTLVADIVNVSFYARPFIGMSYEAGLNRVRERIGDFFYDRLASAQVDDACLRTIPNCTLPAPNELNAACDETMKCGEESRQVSVWI